MMKKLLALLTNLFTLVVFAQQPQSIENYFNHLSHAEKYMFLKRMPKSGELHTHLSGSLYPEALIALGAKYCIQPGSFTINKAPHCDYIKLKDLPNNHTLYEKTLRAWSMKDFHDQNESGHDHFFSTFAKFYSFSIYDQPTLIVEMLKHAIAQNESYLEVIIEPDLNQAPRYANLIDTDKSLEENYEKLIHDKSFMEHIRYTLTRLYAIDRRAKQRLDCKDKTCPIIKYQYYIMRDQPLAGMIAQAVAAFETTNRSTKLVGVNLVQAEDAYTPLKYYKEHMLVLAFLHKHYPKVNIALHAGELNKEAVSPNDLSYHIHDALMTAHAERIGHGTAIAFEDNAEETLAYMKQHDIPVEVNLTSNEDILNSTPLTHPLPLYLNHGVPVVLSTDDEGILRSSLTDEYLKAIEHYGLDYNTLKQINRNGLSYAFLNGQSIWRVNNKAIPVKACQKALKTMKLDESCQSYLDHNAKARHQWNLEFALYRFENDER